MGDIQISRIVGELRRLAPGEGAEREAIANVFPGGAAGCGLKRLSDALQMPTQRLFLTAMRRFTPPIQPHVVPVAVSHRMSPRSERAVIGVPLDVAHQLVDLALGREIRPRQRHLSTGEQGVLLYVLDRAGGDWLTQDGPRFVVKGCLTDALQIPDYLQGPPAWEVTGHIRGTLLNSSVYLWFTDLPAYRKPLVNWSQCIKKIAPWPVVLRLSVGWSVVPATEVMEIEPNDLIIVDALCHPDRCVGDALAVLVCGKWMRMGRFKDRRHFEICSQDPNGVNMDAKDERGPVDVPVTLDSHSRIDTGTMDVVVRVEVGQIRMSVAQAAGLVSGRVLRLDKDVDTSVILRVGESGIIGRGELVEHDGAVAVEVTEVL
ncbi:MAG: FliM/FliN family flagellar motor switch protein [Myxococcota bacterium]|nr:FliM/FliN family flagellar motor switch protein [Myxococcota bacterium]